MFTASEKLMRVLFLLGMIVVLLGMIVVLLDVYYWRP